jgi:hypothetical protein
MSSHTPAEAEALQKFNLWFKEHYKLVKNGGGGHGAFIALSIGLFLTERFFRHETGTIDDHRGPHANDFKAPAATFFNTDPVFFYAFWNVYRNGMQHQGSPKSTPVQGWDVHGDYDADPTKAVHNGKDIICLNPWKFTDKIIAKWESRLDLLALLGSHQLGSLSTQALNAVPVPPTHTP